MEDAIAASDMVNQYIDQLKKENEQLKNNVIQFAGRVEKLEKENAFLHEQLKLRMYQKFARTSEKLTEQFLLFDSGEESAPVKETTETETVKSYTRTKSGRKGLDINIPREDVIIDIAEEEKHCECGSALVCIGEDISERLVIIPEQVYVLSYHIKKYACHTCEGSGDEEKAAVRTGKAPKNIIPGSIATPELLSAIFIRKYCDYVPYYRQEAAFRRIGVELSRQNMSHWQIKVSDKLSPLLHLIQDHIRSGNVIQMDETTMKVMDEPGRENKLTSYMWLMRGGPPGKPALWYEYRQTRAKYNIVDLLSGFSGYLQTDGYSSYESVVKKDLTGIIHVGCFAHSRRYFFEAMKISSGKGLADEALSQIKGLYTVEKDLREQLKSRTITTDEFTEARRNKCEPILQAFLHWLEKNVNTVPGSSRIGEAISYTIGEWSALVRYLDDWQLTPDNNACERGIRPFVMGRKNWVISGSPSGARSSCELYTLIETAKANKLNPAKYLAKVLKDAAEMEPSSNWSQLLPWNVIL